MDNPTPIFLSVLFITAVFPVGFQFQLVFFKLQADPRLFICFHHLA